MKYKTVLRATALTVLALSIATTAIPAFASETDTSSDAAITVDVSTTQSDASLTTNASSSEDALSQESELTLLKERESDPNTGVFMKFLLRLKIRQLENQLNVKKALQ